MPETTVNEWDAERLAIWRAAARGKRGAFSIASATFLSLLNALEEASRDAEEARGQASDLATKVAAYHELCLAISCPVDLCPDDECTIFGDAVLRFRERIENL